MNKLDFVKAYWASERTKNIDLILENFCEDAQFTSPTMQLNGRAKVGDFYRSVLDAVKEITVTPTNSLESGDSIAVEYEFNLVRNSGEKRQGRGFNLFEFKDGRFYRVRCYFNPADF
jgi:ketosteroid isomerase-like protein